MIINGETKIIGFLGSTYKTSKMYRMYNQAFDHLGLNYTYIPLVVQDLKTAIEGIRELGISGVGVTIPYKTQATKYVDELDSKAKKIGALNTIINNGNKLIGYNTDGDGGLKALEEVIEISGKKVILLGAGGAARALAFSLSEKKANLVILNRTLDKAKDLASQVRAKSGTLDELGNEIKDSEIIINTTEIGMFPDTKSLVDPKLLSDNMTVFDIVENPTETQLLKDAKLKGCKVVYGKRMLFWQAVLKFKLFTGVNAPEKVMEEVL